MRKLFTKVCIFIVFHFVAQVLQAQVTGKVFRDFNADGAHTTAAPDPIEPGLKDVTVNAYDAIGTLITATTDASGNYSITGGTGPYRVEFILPAYYFASNGSASNTTVQFVAAGGTADLGVNYPGDYCHTTNPNIYIPYHLNGDGQANGTTAAGKALLGFSYNNTGISPFPPNTYGLQNLSGPTWGVAMQRTSKKVYTTALVRRHVGMGQLGTGGIYVTDLASGSTTSFVDLQTLGINTGTDPHQNLPANLLDPSADPVTFNVAGKVGLGGTDLSDDDKFLYVVNLNQRELVRLEIGSSGVAPTPGEIAQKVVKYPITYSCNNGQVRPWSVKYYKGEVYLGVTCDAETGSSNDLKAIILRLNETTGSLTEVFSFPLLYEKGEAISYASDPVNRDWQPWTNDFDVSRIFGGEFHARPQALIADFEFDVDGSLIIGFLDRLSLQIGKDNWDLSGNGTNQIMSSGDILRAYNNNGVFELETNGKEGASSSKPASAGANNNEGPGGGEFYYNDVFLKNGTLDHQEISLGGLALLKGSNEIVNVVFDPVDGGDPDNNSGGIRWYNNQDGSLSDSYRIYDKLQDGSLGKAGGLGDIELLCNPQPIEIGNRVFMDTDEDGIQDANEMGIDNVIIELWAAGAKVTDTPTDINGQWYFKNLNPDTDYEVKILAASFPAGKQLTASNTGAGAVDSPEDMRDNDATIIGSDAVITYTTGGAGQNNHTLDFGFKAACTTPTAGTNTPAEGTCNGATPNDDAKVDFTGIINADKAEKSEGTTYTGADYSSATGTVSLGDISFTGLKHATAYTFRFWNLANDCFVDVTITTPNKTCVIPCALTATATGTNVKCNLGTDGTATATAAGNAAAVTYLWSNGGTTAEITGLPAGVYTVTVTETASCTATASYTVTEPVVIALVCAKTDVTTVGGTDGTASVTASGGTAPYTYLWSDAAGSTTETISTLAAGTYTVTVADANSCTMVCSSIVNAPGCNLTASANGTNVKCNLGTDGTASVTAAGNISAVTYLWSIAATTAAITGLAAGVYTVTVTETASCTATASYTVTEPTAIVLTCSKTDVTTVGGSDGTVSVTASGGTAPYTYLWSDAAGSTTESISTLAAGTYTVTVTDANLCTMVCSSIVNAPGCNLTANANGTNVKCNLGTDGTASVTAAGNISSVTYLWSNAATTAAITGLAAGVYTVTVTETASCTATASYTVTDPTAIALDCTKTDVTTVGGTDGTASVTASGGTAPYTYLWSDAAGSTTASISGLAAGTYTVTVTDANLCTKVCSSVVSQPGASTCNLFDGGVTVTIDEKGTSSTADDEYVIYANPTGTGLAATYNVSGDITKTGVAYGALTEIGRTSTANATISYVIEDAADANCSIADAAFNLNANTCLLKANPTVLCSDAGTPLDPSDDTYSVTLNPTGNGISATYNVTGGITASNIAYGSAQQIATGLLISAGGVTITVKDSATPNCELINIRIDAPAPCSAAVVCPLKICVPVKLVKN